MNTHPTIMLTSWLSYVSIQISSQKAQKHGSKGLSRVITWPGYKRNVICGEIEIKKSIIEEHSLYSTITIHNFPYQSLQPLVINNLSNNLDNLFYFWSLFLSFSFLFQIYKLWKFSNLYTSMLSGYFNNSPWFLT